MKKILFVVALLLFSLNVLSDDSVSTSSVEGAVCGDDNKGTLVMQTDGTYVCIEEEATPDDSLMGNDVDAPPEPATPAK